MTPEARREYDRKWYTKRGEPERAKRREQGRRWRAANPLEAKVKQMWNAARTRARNADLPFDLTCEWVEERLLRGYCEMTEIEFVHTGRPAGPKAPSIDRVVPVVGYVMSNCRMICMAVNAARGSWGDAAVREILAAYLNSLAEN